jgi:hypothetical protein
MGPKSYEEARRIDPLKLEAEMRAKLKKSETSKIDVDVV